MSTPHDARPHLLLRANHEEALAFALALDDALLALLAALERAHAYGAASGIDGLSVSVPLRTHARFHARPDAFRFTPEQIARGVTDRLDELSDRLQEDGQLELAAHELPEGLDETRVHENVELVLDNPRGQFGLELSWGEYPPERVYSESFDARAIADTLRALAARHHPQEEAA